MFLDIKTHAPTFGYIRREKGLKHGYTEFFVEIIYFIIFSIIRVFCMKDRDGYLKPFLDFYSDTLL